LKTFSVLLQILLLPIYKFKKSFHLITLQVNFSFFCKTEQQSPFITKSPDRSTEGEYSFFCIKQTKYLKKFKKIIKLNWHSLGLNYILIIFVLLSFSFRN